MPAWGPAAPAALELQPELELELAETALELQPEPAAAVLELGPEQAAAERELAGTAGQFIAQRTKLS